MVLYIVNNDIIFIALNELYMFLYMFFTLLSDQSRVLLGPKIAAQMREIVVVCYMYISTFIA